jgi:SET domain-containing protein
MNVKNIQITEIRPSPGKGRGVFALRPIAAGELIERAPVVVIPEGQWEKFEKTILFNYYFSWERHSALVLGYGSLYNHSYQPNARFVRQFKEEAMDFIALRAIATGEEIVINYNGDPTDDSPLWFHALP